MVDIRRNDEQVLKMVKDLTGRKGDDQERYLPQPPDLEGQLEKLKHKTSLLGSWNIRYFVIDVRRHYLLYYVSRKDYDKGERPRGNIDLSEVVAVRKFDDTSFQVESSERTLMLRAASKAEMTCWLTGLQEYVEKRQEFERWRTTYDNAKKSLMPES